MFNQLIFIGGLYVVLGFFEMKFPAEQGQKFIHRQQNIFYTVLLYIVGLFTSVIIYEAIPAGVRYLPDRGPWFSVLIIFAYIFMTDLIFYWYHRAQHRFELLWTIHELHHSEAELNASTGMRSYWLERPIQTLLIAVPIGYVVGVDPTAAVVLPFALTGWLFFTHANWKLDMGIFTPVLTGPQLHRTHHSNLPEHHNVNMAQFFPIIDILFGTYYPPKKSEWPTTGTPALASDAPIGTVLARPFRSWGTAIKRFFS